MTLRLVGADVEVPLVTGGQVRYLNLDYAASTPALEVVRTAVDELLPWYSSVHRGAGYKSIVCTEAYEQARSSVAAFLTARPDDAVIFTRNTTDALNMLAHAVGGQRRVIVFEAEHHANLLPWRGGNTTILPTPLSPTEAISTLTAELDRLPAAGGDFLVTVTGASNVTGELWPVREIIEVSHARGGRVALDAAQLAPHVAIDMTELEVDYLALSGHKLYAPYGSGVLVGRPDWLAAGDPFLAGGGAVKFVTPDEVVWADLPDRQEAGSPNVLGAVALGAACRALQTEGMAKLAAAEAQLLVRAEQLLDAIPQVRLYTTWGRTQPRIGVLTFNVAGLHHAQLAAILSAEYGIGVRHGCFCAHPLMLHLLEVDLDLAGSIREDLRLGKHAAIPGAVRCSFGATTTAADVERFAEALREIVSHGPRWQYQQSDCSDWFDPVPDPRSRRS